MLIFSRGGLLNDLVAFQRGRIMARLVAVLACGIFAQNAAAEPDELDPRIQATFQAWQQRQDALKSLRVTWKERIVYKPGSLYLPIPGDVRDDGSPARPMPSVEMELESPAELVLNGNRWRCEYQGLFADVSKNTTLPHTWESGFDGEKMLSLSKPPVGKPRVDYFATRDKGHRNLAPPFPLVINCRPLDFEFSDFTARDWQVIIDSEPIDGAECLGLQSANRKIFVDPACNYVIRKVTSARPAGRAPSSGLNIQYRQAKDGMWVPSGWTTDTTEATVTEFEIGANVTAEDLRIER